MRGFMIGQRGRVRSLFLAVAILAALSAPHLLRAEEPVVEVVPSLGQFEVFDGGRSWEVGWEARFTPRRFRRLPGFLENATPVAGAMASSQGTLYTYGGFRFEHSLGERWTFTPSWAAGLYHRGTDGGKDLGGTVEFRSGIELAFRVTARSRIGLCLYHLSNGGFYRFNPGTESLILTYGVRP